MKQIRTYEGTQFRLSDIEQDGKKIIGRVIPYNSLSRNLGGFVERFVPGSIADSVKGGEVVALLNHDSSQPVGDQRANTLRLVDSDTSLDCEIALPDTSYARDAVAIMKQRGGTGTGMSFGFIPTDIDWAKEHGTNVAEVRKAQLIEVSVLTGVPPAYQATSSLVRSLGGEHKDVLEEYGIDLDKLASVFLSIRKGLPLSTSEEKTLNEARSLFGVVRRPTLEAAEAQSQLHLV